MIAPCVSIFVGGNEAITRTRDLKVLLPSTPIFLTLPHLPRMLNFKCNTCFDPFINFSLKIFERTLSSVRSVEGKEISKSEDYITFSSAVLGTW